VLVSHPTIALPVVFQILGSLRVFPDNLPRRVLGWSGAVGLLVVAAVAFVVAQVFVANIGRRQF